MTVPRASVIVPTYRDWDALVRCLSCLSAQTLDPALFEIVIGNNNSESGGPAGYDLPINARLVWEPTPGSYAARNAAVAASRGEVLFFTDSDCRPEPDWIANGLAVMDAEASIGRIGGAVEVFPAKADWSVPERYDAIFNLRQERYVARNYAATANLVVRRPVFDRVGPFDPTLFSSGDKEWNGRATRLGVQIVYRSDVRVRHPARADFAALANKRARTTAGRLALKRKRGIAGFASTVKYLAPSGSSLARILRAGGISAGMRARLFAFDYRLRLAQFRAVWDLRYGKGQAKR